jgi:homoserine O-acetyltransferase
MPARLTSHISPDFELSGPPGAPLLVVLGGISATRHVTATSSDASEGWWQQQVGPGLALDTRNHRVLGIDWSAPTRGTITTFDQANTIVSVLDRIGVDRAAAIIGASYGGMVALAFGAAHPTRTDRLVVISAAHESHPMATAHRVIQRRIIRLGLAAGTPSDGVALARALGVTTYRTAAEFAARFDVAPEEDRDGYHFPVERYLDHSARRFAESWSGERYLALSESLDLHRVDPTRVRVPTAILGVREDTLTPPWQLRELRDRLGAPCQLEEISSIYGHDAFLKEVEAVGSFLSRNLQGEVRHAA